MTRPRYRLLLLTGASGSGKSSLVKQVGLPRLQLDDYYRDGTDPTLPRLGNGVVDWDDPRSWDRDRALAAIRVLLTEGCVSVPHYEIGEDRTIGYSRLDLGSAPAVVAEGIFAAELISDCLDEGLLACREDAVVLIESRWTTVYRRLRRDLQHGRKSPLILLRRGLLLLRREPAVVRRMIGLGAVPTPREAVEVWLRAAADS